MQITIDVLAMIGIFAIVYTVVRFAKKEPSEESMLLGWASGKFHELEANSVRNFQSVKKRIEAIESDMSSLSQSDVFSDVQKLASIVNVQRSHITSLQRTVQTLSRRITALQDELEGREREDIDGDAVI